MNPEKARERDSILFYRSFYESISKCPPETQLTLYNAVFDYGLNRIIPDFNGVQNQPFVEAIWYGIRPQIDANHQKFINGCKGGAPSGNRNNPDGRRGKNNQPGTNQELTKNQRNDNVNENVNENVSSSRKSGGKSLTLPYPDNIEFVNTWNELRQQPKWRKKTVTALQKSLNQLVPYPVEFAIELMNDAIAGGYQGVVFPDTPERFRKWQQSHPGKQQGKTVPDYGGCLVV